MNVWEYVMEGSVENVGVIEVLALREKDVDPEIESEISFVLDNDNVGLGDGDNERVCVAV